MSLPTQTRLGLAVLLVAAVVLALRVGYAVALGQPATVSGNDVFFCFAGAIIAVGLYHGWALSQNEDE